MILSNTYSRGPYGIMKLVTKITYLFKFNVMRIRQWEGSDVSLVLESSQIVHILASILHHMKKNSL